MLIYKYQIQLQPTFGLELPLGATVLCVKIQRGLPCIWVAFDPQNKDSVAPRNFAILTTGSEAVHIPAKSRYIGTFLMNAGSFVGHLFEEV